jgi:Na+/glutamate symporter
MITGMISNFDSFAWAAVGLFVAGLLGVMVYEKSSSKARRQQRQTQSQRQQAPGTNTNVEPE